MVALMYGPKPIVKILALSIAAPEKLVRTLKIESFPNRASGVNSRLFTKGIVMLIPSLYINKAPNVYKIDRNNLFMTY